MDALRQRPRIWTNGVTAHMVQGVVTTMPTILTFGYWVQTTDEDDEDREGDDRDVGNWFANGIRWRLTLERDALIPVGATYEGKVRRLEMSCEEDTRV